MGHLKVMAFKECAFPTEAQLPAFYASGPRNPRVFTLIRAATLFDEPPAASAQWLRENRMNQ